MIPAAVAIVVKVTGPPKLCRADEVGEICLYANSTGFAYWGLDGLSASTFKVYSKSFSSSYEGFKSFIREIISGRTSRC